MSPLLLILKGMIIIATQTYKVVMDTGNGYVKTNLSDTTIPSVLAIQRQQDIYDPVTFATPAEEQNYVNDLLNRLDVVAQSPEIHLNQRVFVGKSAVDSQLPLTGFDVNSLNGKADTDLSMILPLSLIAAQAVKDAYNESKTLPDRLLVHANLATALPIMEGKRSQVIKHYEDRYLGHEHIITLRNFEKMITVTIVIDNIVVLLEGEAAQYAIHHPNVQLSKIIMEDFKQHYPKDAKEIKVADLVNEPDVLSLDIGDGTTDVAVFNTRGLNLQASSSTLTGYGNALLEAVSELQAQGFNIHSRSELQKLVTTKPTPLTRARIQKAQKAIDNQLDNLTHTIVDAVSTALRQSSSGINLIFVHGGGATPLESRLREAITEKSKQFTADVGIPVIFIDAPLGQMLNEQGLELALDLMD